MQLDVLALRSLRQEALKLEAIEFELHSYILLEKTKPNERMTGANSTKRRQLNTMRKPE